MEERHPNTQMELIAGLPPENLKNKEWKKIRRERLINSLNRINFQNGEVVINFRDLKYKTLISIPAKPQPCLDHYFECKWSESIDVDYKVNHYRFENFYFRFQLFKSIFEFFGFIQVGSKFFIQIFIFGS